METAQEILGYKIHSNDIMDEYVKEITEKVISFIDLQNDLELVCEIFKITWKEEELVPDYLTRADVPYGKLSIGVKILRNDLFHVVLVELDKFFNRCFAPTITIHNYYINIDIKVLMPNKLLNDDFFINKVFDRYKKNIFRVRLINKLHKLLHNYTSDII